MTSPDKEIGHYSRNLHEMTPPSAVESGCVNERPERGHEDQSPPPRPSARRGFGERTFATIYGNGQDAPRFVDLPALIPEAGRFVPSHSSLPAPKRVAVCIAWA